MDQTTRQATNVIQQVLEGLSVENKLIALGAVSALEIANHHIGRDEKNELSQRFAASFLGTFSDLMEMRGCANAHG